MVRAQNIEKPLLRGYFHEAAFYFSIGACGMLLARCFETKAFPAVLVYSSSLVALFGISALYHRVNWSPAPRIWMRRLDHSAIFVLIAGTGTPVFFLSLPETSRLKVLVLVWSAAIVGVFKSLIWTRTAKWFTALLCVSVGWIIVPYFSELQVSLEQRTLGLILGGGFFYTIGAVIYALKKPNFFPKIFGYHEIFHILVVIGAGLHFLAIYGIV
jgi:hemolysin III